MTQDIINTRRKALELGEPGANLVMVLHKIPNYDQQLREFGRLQAE